MILLKGAKNEKIKTVEETMTILANCQVCRQPVYVDEYGQSIDACKRCGWIQDPTSINSPDKIDYPNFVSLNKTKKLYGNGKKLMPDYNDFIEAFKLWGEIGFKINGKIYEAMV